VDEVLRASAAQATRGAAFSVLIGREPRRAAEKEGTREARGAQSTKECEATADTEDAAGCALSATLIECILQWSLGPWSVNARFDYVDPASTGQNGGGMA